MIEANKAVGVGLIGYGFAGKTFHAPLVRAIPQMTLAGVASSDAAKVRKDIPDAEVFSDPAQLIAQDDVELIVIATPNDSHAPLARAALSAGKHVVIDKPFALDLVEARALVALANQKDRLLSVFHNRRWDSDFLGAKLGVEGLVGTVTHFESHIDRFRPLVRNRWRENAGPGSGVWYDLGPHLIDQTLQLFGVPDGVMADLRLERQGAKTVDWAHVVLEYPALRVILHASMLVAGGTPRFAVHGDMGSLIKRDIDRQEAQAIAGMVPGAAGWGVDPDDMLFWGADGECRNVPTPAGDHRHYYAAIADAVRGRAPNPVTPVQALAVMAVLEAGIESSASRRTVPVPLTETERASLAA